MAHTIEQFAKQCSTMLKADPGPAGRQKVCQLLKEVLTDKEFVEKYGEDNAKYLFEQLGNHTRQYKRFTYIEMGVEPDRRYALQLEREAQERGFYLRGELHRNSDLEILRGRPEFQALMT